MNSHFIIFLPEYVAIVATVLTLILHALVARSIKLKFNGELYPNFFESAWITMFVLLLAYSFLTFLSPAELHSYFGLYSNNFIYLLRCTLCLAFIIFFLYLRCTDEKYPSEFPVILFCAFLSLHLLLRSSSFLNIFLFMEFYSICAYYLIGSPRDLFSAEAAFKYFIYGSLGTICFLMGCFFTYLATGCFDIFDIKLLATAFSFPPKAAFPYAVGTLLLALSLIFKLGLGPTYIWMVDVYAGVRYPTLIFLLTFPKVVYIYLLVFFVSNFAITLPLIVVKFFVLVSLFIGVCGAVLHSKIRLFVLYISLANMAFLFIPMWELDPQCLVIFYIFLFNYLINTMCFVVLLSSLTYNIPRGPSKLVELSHLVNLRSQYPQLWYLFLLITIITGGLPVTALFLFKFLFFVQFATQASFLPLLVIAASWAYYFFYIKIIRLLFTKDKSKFIVLFIPLSEGLLNWVIVVLLLNLIFLLCISQIFSLILVLLV